MRAMRENFTDGRTPDIAPRPLQSDKLDPKVSKFAVRDGRRQADARLHRLLADDPQSPAESGNEEGGSCGGKIKFLNERFQS